jgi:hypothetical protein
MIPLSSRRTVMQPITRILSCVLVLVIMTTALGCNFIAEDTDEESLESTQTALSAEQTDLAEQSGGDINATIAAQQATIDAQAAQATQVAMVPPPGTTPLVPPEMPPGTTPLVPPGMPGTTPMAPVAPPSGDFTQMMKTASVLLYEDIVAMPAESRYVLKTLQSMGIQSVKDDGNAVGWLKTDLLGSAPGGRPWDLVIIAQEARGTVSGEFYQYLGNLLQQGTSVIVEDWNLGNVVEGAVAPTLAQCGVYAYPWWSFTGNINDVVMWPLGIPHPVLSQPNSGLAFTRARDTWLTFGQLGSQLALTGKGDAVLLLGTKTQEQYKDGTLAVCMGGRLIIQGFSSHSFEFMTMYPLWENYIYNALQVRLLGGS